MFLKCYKIVNLTIAGRTAKNLTTTSVVII